MTEPQDPRLEDQDDEAFERMLAKHSEPTPDVRAAMTEVEAARADMTRALDDLVGATQEALDIPAKVRRNPVRAAALVGGTGFLLAGGPRRVVRFIGRRVRRQPPPDPYAGILPDEIEQVLKDSGVARDPDVRRALNRDFADYLRQKGSYQPEPNAATSFWRTFDTLAGPLGSAGARILVQRLMEAEQDRGQRRKDAHERRRQRPSSGVTTSTKP